MADSSGNLQTALPDPLPVRKLKTSTLIPVFALALFIALAGWLYWKFIYYPTTPQYALETFFVAARNKDYDKIYNLVLVPPAAKVLVRNGQDLKAMAQRFPGLVPTLHEYKIGSVELNGDNAQLDATTTLIGADQKPTDSQLKVKMIRTNGIWRVDGNWIMSEIGKKGLNGLLLNGTE